MIFDLQVIMTQNLIMLDFFKQTKIELSNILIK